MGSHADDRASDWKGGHLRINSNDAGAVTATTTTTTTAHFNSDDDNKADEMAQTSPRLGLDSMVHESRPEGAGEDGAFVLYKVYRRRWFGLVQLALLNTIVSWDWLTFSPVAGLSATFFDVSESAINWLSTSFLFAFCVVVPVVIYVLHWGPKPSIMAASVLLLVGNWVRYGGVMASTPSFAVVMFGQILIGLSQPFVLAAPTRYSDLWFTDQGRVAATALTSLANPFGAALGQLIMPFWVTRPADIPSGVLYVSIIATVCAVPSFFIPAKPPTPAAPSGTTTKLPLATSALALARSPEFWMLLAPFVAYVGLFNSLSSLLSQIMTPYGFTDDEAGIAGAVLIVVGLAVSAVAAPLLDRTKAFVPAIKLATPVVALAFLAFVWMPDTRAVAGPYAVCALLGAASFSLVPVVTEFLVEVSHPVSPEVTSTLAWAGGQLLGGIFIVVADALKAGSDGHPPGNMKAALVFHAVVALAVLPAPLCLGLFGRADKVVLRRVVSDRRDGEGEVEEEEQVNTVSD